MTSRVLETTSIKLDTNWREQWEVGQLTQSKSGVTVCARRCSKVGPWSGKIGFSARKIDQWNIVSDKVRGGSYASRHHDRKGEGLEELDRHVRRSTRRTVKVLKKSRAGEHDRRVDKLTQGSRPIRLD